MTKLEAALDAARRGFHIFPLAPNTKKPALKGDWKEHATQDESQIRQWWESNPEYNLAGRTDAFFVVDVDINRGGLATIQALRLMEGSQKTLTSMTHSGGGHQIYALPPGVSISGGVDKLGPGVDVKSYGGYIVLPGSTIKENPYVWVRECAPEPAPQWMLEKCQTPKGKSALAGKRLVEEDETTYEMAENWLRLRAPREVNEGRRDAEAFAFAARMYDFAAERTYAREMTERWNGAACFPPLDSEDIERVVRSAETNRANPIGIDHPLASFSPVEIAARKPKEAAPAAVGKFYYLRADASSRRALLCPREPLIENIMHRGAEAVMIGAPGGGKTFGALDLSYHVTKGLPWAGNATHQGAVVYFAAEAQEGINTRVAALEKHYGALDDTPLFVVPVAPDLAHGLEDTRQMVDLIKKVEAECGQTVELFVVDTLNRVIAGGDENGSKDMGAVLNATRIIRAATSSASLIIHHPGKDESKGGRGHSSVFGAVDTEMRMARHTLTVTKWRDGVSGHKVNFRIMPIRIGADTKGRDMTSCYVQIRMEGEIDPIGLTPAENEIMEVIAAGTEDDNSTPFTIKEIIKWMTETDGDTMVTPPPKRTALLKHVRALSQKGWLNENFPKRQPGQYLRAEPK